MNVIAKKIARSLGQFSVLSITPTKNPDLSCPLCEKKIEGHFMVFDCDHFGCKDCVDKIVDDEEQPQNIVEEQPQDVEMRFMYDTDTILTCPVCLWKVKNIEYK